MNKNSENNKPFGTLVSGSLEKIVANKYVMQMMLQNVKWNTRGPLFHKIQHFVDSQRDRLLHNMEEVVERMHMLEASKCIQSFDLQRCLELDEHQSSHKTDELIQKLIGAFRRMIVLCRSGRVLAKVSADDVTADILDKQVCYYRRQVSVLGELLLRGGKH